MNNVIMFNVASSWYEIGADSRKAANRLVSENYRSCLSRSYYAAYSKVTQALADAGVAFPMDREGPNHPGASGGGIRKCIEQSMPDMSKDKRVKLSELVGRLYTLRIVADYRPSVEVDARDAREALSIMNKIFEAF